MPAIFVGIAGNGENVNGELGFTMWLILNMFIPFAVGFSGLFIANYINKRYYSTIFEKVNQALESPLNIKESHLAAQSECEVAVERLYEKIVENATKIELLGQNFIFY